ncbi:MAG: hypothetical protein VB051_05180 [Candidatus Pelethousia sp.]|nr:hypothetical protein [Candidatus Pelethousia sp.]
MKPLIIYYSHTGNNEKLALKIEDRLGCEILKIDEKKKRKTISILLDFIFNRNSKLSGYQIADHEHDVFILIAPIWGGRIASPMRAFLEKESYRICKYFFISLCNGETGQKEKIAAELSSIIQREPIGVTELWINRLLPEDQQNKVKHTFNYKVRDHDLKRFEADIEKLVGEVSKT